MSPMDPEPYGYGPSDRTAPEPADELGASADRSRQGSSDQAPGLYGSDPYGLDPYAPRPYVPDAHGTGAPDAHGADAYAPAAPAAYGAAPPTYEPGVPGWTDPRPSSGAALAGMVCGIVSLSCCGLSAIPGLILSIMGMQATTDGRATGRGMAVAGLVTSIVGTLLLLGGLAYFVLVIWYAGTSSSTS